MIVVTHLVCFCNLLECQQPTLHATQLLLRIIFADKQQPVRIMRDIAVKLQVEIDCGRAYLWL